jgi:hypothetical protein
MVNSKLKNKYILWIVFILYLIVYSLFELFFNFNNNIIRFNFITKLMISFIIFYFSYFLFFNYNKQIFYLSIYYWIITFILSICELYLDLEIIYYLMNILNSSVIIYTIFIIMFIPVGFKNEF